MSEKIKVGYTLPEDVVAMLEEMKTAELRTLSATLELCIRERYATRDQPQLREPRCEIVTGREVE